MIAAHRTKRTVRFAETDATGFVYFGSYVRMMEETEYDFLRSRDLCVVLTDDKGIIGFPRLSAEIEVREPVRFDDKIEIQLDLTEMDGKHIVYQFEIHCGGQTAATGKFRVACCRFPGQETPFAILTPEFVMDRLADNC